jgi:hypothetical protein
LNTIKRKPNNPILWFDTIQLILQLILTLAPSGLVWKIKQNQTGFLHLAGVAMLSRPRRSHSDKRAMTGDTTANVRTRSFSAAAERMRLYRKRRRDGMRYVRIPLHVTDIDALIRMRLLKEEQRHDAEALQTAVLGLVYRATEDLT